VCTDFAVYVDEYNARQRLRKIGYVDSVDGLDAKDATIFLEISSMYDKLDQEKLKKKSKKGR